MVITTRQINMIIQMLKKDTSKEGRDSLTFYQGVLLQMLAQKKPERDVDLTDLGEVGENFKKIIAQLENKNKIMNEESRGRK